MFPKAALTFLAVGALSVNALTIPVARSPAPEPASQEPEAWMLKRDLSYQLFSRELQALEELFSREPEDWAEWAGFARNHHAAKREPYPRLTCLQFERNVRAKGRNFPLRCFW